MRNQCRIDSSASVESVKTEKSGNQAMKAAVSAIGADLDASVDIRFGGCQYFIIVDSDTLEFEAIKNPNIGLMSRTGIQSSKMMAHRGVQAILTGESRSKYIPDVIGRWYPGDKRR